MDEKIRAIAERLRGMREISGLSEAEMAAATGVTEEDYRIMESGGRDFSFTFLFKASQRFGIDLTELVSGESPRLSGYELIRAGEGLPIVRREGFRYLNLAYMFKSRLAEPFMVTAPYENGNETCMIAMSTHEGQEMDHVLSGQLRISINGHEETMRAGDTVYYDSSKPHGMVAVGGDSCSFLAIVMDPARA
ncbi:MAG: cupin domain-containing protein [Clostridia bacterium]|nr:cupin domain-containing protein [Clostridia bacterium]